MPAESDDRLSWWVGLSRRDFYAEIMKREAAWKAHQAGWLDHVGASIIGWREPIIRRRTPDD